MPYAIVWKPDGVIIRYSGIVSYDENIAANGQLYGDPRFESIKYQIADFLTVTDFQISKKESSIIGELDFQSTRWNSHIKVAHITQDNDIIERVKVYEETMKDTAWEFGIFNTMEEAQKWVEGK